MNPTSLPSPPATPVTQPLAGEEVRVLEALRQVIDPEIGMNLVDLGLIYSVHTSAGHAEVIMTLTTAGCPMHDSLTRGVKTALLQLPGIQSAEVQVVWDPPWHPSMMSDTARQRLGIRL